MHARERTHSSSGKLAGTVGEDRRAIVWDLAKQPPTQAPTAAALAPAPARAQPIRRGVWCARGTHPPRIAAFPLSLLPSFPPSLPLRIDSVHRTQSLRACSTLKSTAARARAHTGNARVLGLQCAQVLVLAPAQVRVLGRAQARAHTGNAPAQGLARASTKSARRRARVCVNAHPHGRRRARLHVCVDTRARARAHARMHASSHLSRACARTSSASVRARTSIITDRATHALASFIQISFWDPCSRPRMCS